MEGKFFPLLMQLISAFSQDPTTLRQEMPILPPAPPEQVVDYLDTKDHSHTVLWQEAKKYWAINPPKGLDIHPENEPVINPDSILGYLVSLTKAPLENLERNLHEKVNTTLDEAVDEVDRATLIQIANGLQCVWSLTGPWIKARLIDGALFSYIDQQQYLKAAEFSYLNMAYHGQALRIHRDLLSLAPRAYTDRTKDRIIREKEIQDHQKFWLWHERFITTARVNHVLHHLTNMFHFYDEQFRKAHKLDLLDLSYKFLSIRSSIDDAICELKASHHNHLAKQRSKNWFGATLEKGMNFVAEWFWKHGYYRTPRPFHDVLSYCEQLATQEYNNLKVYRIPTQIRLDREEEVFLREEEKIPTETILAQYIEAIEADNFIVAKKNCTWYPTQKPVEPREGVARELVFDWLREYQDMENYYREIQKIFYYQDILREILSHLYELSDHAFSDNKRQLYEGLIQAQLEARREIYLLHRERHELKKSYINEIKTKFNYANKGLWERFSDSLNRKAFRYFKDGAIYHSIKPYEEQIQSLHKQLRFSCSRIDFIKSLVLGGYPKDPFFKGLISDYRYVHHRFSPFFITEDRILSLYHESDVKDSTRIQVLCEFADRNRRWFPDQKIWEPLFNVINIYLSLYTQMLIQHDESQEVERDLIRFEHLMRKQLSKDNGEDRETLLLLNRFEEDLGKLKSSIQSSVEELSQIFKDTMGTLINLHTPLDTGRIVSSLGRKSIRLITTGEILSSKKSLIDEEPTFSKLIITWAKKIKQNRIKLEKLISLLSKGNSEGTAHLPSLDGARGVGLNPEGTILASSIIEDYIPTHS